MERLKIIGLMSGTSLDGLDLAACEFIKGDFWEYQIHSTKTIEYDQALQNTLSQAINLSGQELTILNQELGILFGNETKRFMTETDFQPDYISSHGHTIFHQPEKRITTQIGNPAAIASLTRIPVIGDFRNLDVQLGGQGAPLVPIGDKHLFKKYKYCLNLGGISNISIKTGNEISAFDIGIANIALNYVAKRLGKKFDENGDEARSGKPIAALLSELNKLEYHFLSPPKSLGVEWFESQLRPILDFHLNTVSEQDVLCTLCHHVAFQVKEIVKDSENILVTGGGALNSFLMNLMIEAYNLNVQLPEKNIIEFKEALVFGFLGALRARNEVNVLSQVTGSSHDHSAGIIYNPDLG